MIEDAVDKALAKVPGWSEIPPTRQEEIADALQDDPCRGRQSLIRP
jgi:hypothetical protein